VAYLDEITRRQDVPHLANASGIFQCMHGGTVGWREVSMTDQLHISVLDGTVADAFEDCHIDETSFTWGRTGEGVATPAPIWYAGIPHFLQSQLKMLPIAAPFDRLDLLNKSPMLTQMPLSADTVADIKDWPNVAGKKAVAGEAGHKEGLALWERFMSDIRGAGSSMTGL
jgi:hypothetical protein